MKGKTKQTGNEAGKVHVIFRALVLAAAVLAAAGCAKKTESAAVSGSAAKDSRLVKGEAVATVFAVNTTKAVRGQITNYLELNGDVETKSTVDIFADTMGKLVTLNIRVGDRITKNQVIAEVDPSRPGSVFVASPVKSPIAGTITSIPVYVGSTVSQATPIARITTTDRLQIRTDVAERFISQIRVGLDAVLQFEAYPGESFAAVISELSPVVDPQTRTLEVKLNLIRPDRRIKAGMFAAIKIITERKENIVKIPADCVVRRFGEAFVFVVKPDPGTASGGTVERRLITPGILIDNKIEIIDGLSADEPIVIQGQTLLEDKSAVKVVGETAPLPVSDRIR
jgi:multidrug efflux pump subunit AcrA (membrane-fusion protein)